MNTSLWVKLLFGNALAMVNLNNSPSEGYKMERGLPIVPLGRALGTMSLGKQH